MKKFTVVTIVLVALGVGWGISKQENNPRTSSNSFDQADQSPPPEPSPPDYLDLQVDDGDASSSTIDFTVTVDSEIDSEYQIEVIGPKGARFESGYSSARFKSDPDASSQIESLKINKAASNGVVVEVRLTLLDDNGEPWMVINKSHLIGEPVADSGAARYPVVFERADGSKFVEYMTQDEAAQRGLPIFESSGEQTASPPGESNDPDEDSDDGEVQQ